MTTANIFPAGIDLSKSHLDVAIPHTDTPRADNRNPDGTRHARHVHRRFNNDPQGRADMIQWLSQQRVSIVVLEATGGLQRPVVRQLAAAGLPFHVANPRVIRDFARACNQLAKTDRIDAVIIARYAAMHQPKAHELPSESRQKLLAAVTRHQQLTDMLIAERNRLHRTEDHDMRQAVQRSIEFIEQQSDEVLQHIDALISADDDMRTTATRLATTPGLGSLTASRLVAMLPELGECNSRQIARLVGLAPINRDSGQMRGKRSTGGGKSAVRKLLYMPTVTAIQHNPVIRKTYQHLLQNGKPKLVALIAAMRKLVILLNTMEKQQLDWNQLNCNT